MQCGNLSLQVDPILETSAKPSRIYRSFRTHPCISDLKGVAIIKGVSCLSGLMYMSRNFTAIRLRLQARLVIMSLLLVTCGRVQGGPLPCQACERLQPTLWLCKLSRQHDHKVDLKDSVLNHPQASMHTHMHLQLNMRMQQNEQP